jgi:2'-5' RNA ligase
MLKNFSEFNSLTEKKGETYDYGCAMVYFDMPKMKELHDLIDPEDIYYEEGDRSYGLEDEPHTTLLYGLHSNVDPQEIMELCKSVEIGELRLHNVSSFNNQKYDVLKFDVENPSLYEINAKLQKLPHTTDFPNYHPHATIGYLKPGTAQKYIAQLAGVEYTAMPNSIVYSLATGGKITEPI